MRAWVEPDDEDVPVISVMVIKDEAVIDGYFRATHPKKWHLEINEVPDEQ